MENTQSRRDYCWSETFYKADTNFILFMSEPLREKKATQVHCKNIKTNIFFFTLNTLKAMNPN